MESNAIEDYKNTLFIKIGNQLGNCLRIISSCCIIAKYYGMNAYIDMSVSQLWPKELDIVNTLFPHLCKNMKSTDYMPLNYNKYVRYDNFYGTNYHLINEGRFEKPADTNNISIVSNIYNIIPGDMSEDEFIREKIRFYKSITYPHFLLDAVSRFNEKHNLSIYTAFHIRHTDNLNDRQKYKHNFNTSLEIFIQKLNKCLSNSEKIIVFSDNNDVLKMVKEIHSDILVTDKIEFPHFQNLYEMMLLSKCNRIIGSNSSTFSYESAFLQGTDIELYENGEWKLYELKKIDNII